MREESRFESAECKSDSHSRIGRERRRLPAVPVDGSSKAGRFDAAGARLAREWKTMEAMIHLHCRDQHVPTGDLCQHCQALSDYAAMRLERCRFGSEKPTCANCPVHCYQATRREQIKAVMRYAGPRMLWMHPLLSLRHWLDGFRPAPKL